MLRMTLKGMMALRPSGGAAGVLRMRVGTALTPLRHPEGAIATEEPSAATHASNLLMRGTMSSFAGCDAKREEIFR